MKKYWISLFLAACCACSVQSSGPAVPEKAGPKIPVVEKAAIDEILALRAKKDFKGVIGLYHAKKEMFSGPDLLKYVSESYFMEKDYETVIKTVEQFFSKFPHYQDGRLNLMLGVSYYNINLFEAARRNLIKAEELGVRDRLLDLYFVLVYLNRGQYSLALSYASNFEGVLREYLRGIIYFKEGDYRKALEKFNKLADFGDSRLFRIYCMYYSGESAAIDETGENEILDKYPETLILLADINIKSGRIIKAKKLLEDALKIDKTQAAAWRNLGMIYELYMGDREKAEQYYKEYLKIVNDEEVKGWLKGM